MTKTQVEVITSVQRRRRWSRAEKEQIVAASIGGCRNRRGGRKQRADRGIVNRHSIGGRHESSVL